MRLSLFSSYRQARAYPEARLDVQRARQQRTVRKSAAPPTSLAGDEGAQALPFPHHGRTNDGSGDLLSGSAPPSTIYVGPWGPFSLHGYSARANSCNTVAMISYSNVRSALLRALPPRRRPDHRRCAGTLRGLRWDAGGVRAPVSRCPARKLPAGSGRNWPMPCFPRCRLPGSPVRTTAVRP